MAMVLAHLVGDYILQWDSLAAAKSYSLRGVLLHGAIITGTTWAFTIPFDATWLAGVAFISGTHILIDASQLYLKPPISPVLRFIVDQALHFLMILIALVAGGYLVWGDIIEGTLASAAEMPYLSAITLYAFITMPAWVMLKFFTYAVVKHQPPNFSAGPNKFVGITERLLMSTMIALGQFFLIPLASLPRLISLRSGGATAQFDTVYYAELISSIGLALVAGVALRVLLV